MFVVREPQVSHLRQDVGCLWLPRPSSCALLLGADAVEPRGSLLELDTGDLSPKLDPVVTVSQLMDFLAL